MYKIIGADGKEYGPVTLEQLRQWMTEGRVNAQTQVQAEGAPDWKPLSSYPELIGPAIPAPAQVPAARAPWTPPSADQDYQVEIGQWLTAGWELYKSRFGLLLGATLVTFLLMGAGGAAPFVGGIIGIIINGPLMGGLYLTVLRVKRNEEAGVGNIFDGFRLAFGQLILAYLIPSLLAGICVVPGVLGLIAGIGLAAAQKGNETPGIVVAVIGGLVLLIGFCAAIYLSLCWMFTIPLVADKQMGFWDAMKLSRQVVKRHWWGWFGFSIVVGLVVMLGILGCGIGIIFTMPIAFAAWMCGYEAVFNRQSTAAA